MLWLNYIAGHTVRLSHSILSQQQLAQGSLSTPYVILVTETITHANIRGLHKAARKEQADDNEIQPFTEGVYPSCQRSWRLWGRLKASTDPPDLAGSESVSSICLHLQSSQHFISTGLHLQLTTKAVNNTPAPQEIKRTRILKFTHFNFRTSSHFRSATNFLFYQAIF